MQREKRGFTVIELIAVIVILGIILAITIPSVTGIIKRVRERVCVIDADVVEKAAKTYVQIEGIEITVGESIKIPLETLQSKDYLSEVFDPSDIKTACTGYANVTNNNGNYEYKGSISCPNLCQSDDYNDGTDTSTSPDELDTTQKYDAKYFEGANPNNWVKFGRSDPYNKSGLMWRIVKIDEYGVKMVYEGNENGLAMPLEDGRALIDGTMGISWNSNGINKWNSPASLVNKLNSWLSKLYIQDSTSYLYETNWMVGGVPYEDPTNINSFLTYQGIDSSNTGGDFSGLTNYKSAIGTINAVDFMFTSDNADCSESYMETGSTNVCAYNTDSSLNNFLQKDKYHYWTLNARSDTANRAWNIANSGLIGSSLVNLPVVSVRPILNLKPSTVFLAGSGTIDDPYIVEPYMVGIWDAPIITLNGNDSVSIKQGDTYIDEGATAYDEKDGDISNAIIATGTVNTGVVGTYTITYNVTDSDNNKALPIARTIYVVEPDTPIITLNGDNPTYVTVHSNYVEDSATAFDINYGDISSSINIAGIVDTNTIGIYYVTYNVTNVDGKRAPEVVRKVIVKAPTPTIALNGDSIQLVDIGSYYDELGATASDPVDGDLTSQIVKTIEVYEESTSSWRTTSYITTSELYEYRIKYSVTNSYGVNSVVKRQVKVTSVNGPIITYTPEKNETPKKTHETIIKVDPRNYPINPYTMKYFTFESKSRLIGELDRYFKTAYNNPDTLKINDGTGLYYYYAKALDNFGNATYKKSGVFKVDNSKPTIKLNTGVSSIKLHSVYTDPGATAFDKFFDGNITSNIISTSFVNPDVEGYYNVKYEVTDSAGNYNYAYRNIRVYQPSPRLGLIGGSRITIKYGTPFVDPGATAYDDVEGNITDRIVVTGDTVNHLREGIYNIHYYVENSLHYSATRDRIVEVKIPSPVITILGSNPVNLKVNDEYVDAGASALDELDGDLTSRIERSSNVDTSRSGTYTVTYTVVNNLGKTTTATRTVIVTAPKPVITILGNNPYNMYKCQTYTDAGATAVDDIDGDISGNIITSGTVSPCIEGSYNVTYSVTNSQGQTSTKIRTVNVRKSNLVINLLGEETMTLTKGSVYNEPGYTAQDDVDGNVTSNVVVDMDGFNSDVPKTYHFKYSVTNSAGDTVIVQRAVIVEPSNIVITIIGEADITIVKGSAYSDAGATAVDELEGPLSVSTVSDVNPSVVGIYRVTYSATNSGGDTATKQRIVRVREPEITITLLGQSTVQLPIGTTYIDAGATANDEILGDISNKITMTNTINPNLLGTYYVEYTVISSGVTKTVRRTVEVVPQPGPIISFTLRGDSTWKTTNQTTVTITKGDHNPDPNTYKYLWSKSIVQPSESLFETLFASGQSIKTPTGASGSYYLWIIAKDIYGNTSIMRSNAFNIDNTAPILTLKGAKVIEIPVDGTYADLGVNVEEIDSGLDANGVVITSTVIPGIIGTYNVTYNAKDKAGNVAQTITRTVSVIESKLMDAPSEDFISKYNASYFVGANPNNWVAFGDAAASEYDYIPIMWRIIKADDNGIKIVYEGTKEGDHTIQNGTIGKNVWDSVNNNWNRPAAIITLLNNFYNNLNEPNKSTLTVNLNWCVGNVNSPYALYDFQNGSCSVMSTNQSAVGLINAEDYILTSKDACSGYNEASCGTNNFLRKSYSYFTLNGDTASSVATFLVNSNGGLTRDEVSKNYDIRPVINLKPDILILGGEGTFDNPYTLNTRTPSVDNTPPTITFNLNSIDQRKVDIVVTDNITGVDTSSLKYVWTTSSVQPTIESIINSFSNGDSIDKPSDAANNYYLWAIAKDKKGNQRVASGGPYLVDNEAPVITLIGGSIIKHKLGSVFVDPGYNVTDNYDTNVNVTVQSNLNPSIRGTYTITYTATDDFGNQSSVSRTVIVDVKEIWTATDLYNVRNDLTADYIVMTDIDLSSSAYATDFPIITGFNGTFDGGNHTISNLKVTRSLFDSTTQISVSNLTLRDVTVNSTVLNTGAIVGLGTTVNLDNVHITGVSNVTSNKNYTGALIGKATTVTINNSSYNGSVSGVAYTGGLLGDAPTSTITNSSVTSTVNGSTYVGGLIGNVATLLNISNSSMTGSVTGTSQYVGGLVGYGVGTTITSSYAEGSVNSGSAGYAGGFAGYLTGTANISNSYSTNNVTGSSYIGGLVGRSLNTLNVTMSYTTGNVTGGTAVGGITGGTSGGTISKCYASGALRSTTTSATQVGVGGIAGYSSNGIINDTFVVGNVTGGVSGGYAGGIVGSQSGGNVSRNYVLGKLTNVAAILGDIGAVPAYAYNYYIGETTTVYSGNYGSVIQTIIDATNSTKYAGFDFTNVWNIEYKATTPYLRGLIIPDKNYLANNPQYAGDGSGTIEDPYIIRTADDLNNIRNSLGSHYKLANNIDMSTSSYATNLPVIIGFNGTLDGNGYTISNLKMNRGLFISYETIGVKNLTLNNVTVNGTTQYQGAFIAKGVTVSLDNVHITGTSSVTSTNSFVGGLVGDASTVTISNSSVTSTVSGTTYIGGLVGNASTSLSISNSSMTGAVNGTSQYIGGLVGYGVGTTITNSYAEGSVGSGSASYVGGFAGYLTGTTNISNSYSTNNITSGAYAGGLIGRSLNILNVTMSYTTGNVTGTSYVGGITGGTAGGTISKCYASGALRSTTTSSSVVGVGGIAGLSSGSIYDTFVVGSVTGGASGGYAGGIVGSQSGGNVSRNYVLGKLTNVAAILGDVGSVPAYSNNYYIGETTTVYSGNYGAVIQTIIDATNSAKYAGFDFANVWNIEYKTSTPYLRGLIVPDKNYLANNPQYAGDGSGTIEDPYIVRTADDLNNIRNSLGSHYKLANNIDMAGSAYATNLPVINGFNGTLDGNGYTISNLKMNRGLFISYDTMEIKNLTLNNVTVNGTTQYQGAFIAKGVTVSLDNVHITGTSNVTSTNGYVGGLVGDAATVTISNSSVTSTVSGTTYIGGLIGNATNSLNISNSSMTGSIPGSGANIGGLVGNGISTTITNSYASGSVGSSSASYVGGFAGYLSGTTNISNSYSTNNVTGGGYVGGLIGRSLNTLNVTMSYTTGNVTGTSYVGGITGGTAGGTISKCYASGTLRSTTTSSSVVGVGGIAGLSSGAVINDNFVVGSVTGGASGGYAGGIAGSQGGGNVSRNYVLGKLTNVAAILGDIGAVPVYANNYYIGETTTVYSGNYGAVIQTIIDATDSAKYTGFDFANVWNIEYKTSTPYLRGLIVPEKTYLANNPQYIGDGSGTIEDPYIVRTADDLNNIRNSLGSHYKLANNIDMAGSAYATNLPVINGFNGTLDGNGYTISNLKMNRGLFISYDTMGIKNLTLNNVTVNGTIQYQGAFIAKGVTVSLDNVHITGTSSVTSTNGYVGGLVGDASTVTISNSSVTSTVSGTTCVGGLIGNATNSLNISNSSMTGSVPGSGANIGGLVGNGISTTITNSYASGSVGSSSASYVGGFAGYLSGTTNISNSYSTNNVTGGGYVGGLIGRSLNTLNVTMSYTTGNVTGTSYVGGITGGTAGGTISKCYVSGALRSTTTSASVVGVGGIAGLSSYANINDTFVTGSITGGVSGGIAGGLVGSQSGGNVSRNYVLGALTNTKAILGDINAVPTYASNYYIGETTGVSTGSYGTLISTINDAVDFTKYPGFDFTNVWNIESGISSPYLRGVTIPTSVYLK